MRYKERCHKSRANFLCNLRKWVAQYTSRNVVYFDESGFAKGCHRVHAWAKRGCKVYGDVQGKREKKTNLIMAQRGQEWLTPMLFEKSCTHRTVNAWIEQALLKELKEPSLIIMDNAPFHNKTKIRQILEAHGHTLLPLPPYSPDLNPIEQSFAILKKRCQFSGYSLQQLLSN